MWLTRAATGARRGDRDASSSSSRRGHGSSSSRRRDRDRDRDKDRGRGRGRGHSSSDDGYSSEGSMMSARLHPSRGCALRLLLTSASRTARHGTARHGTRAGASASLPASMTEAPVPRRRGAGARRAVTAAHTARLLGAVPPRGAAARCAVPPTHLGQLPLARPSNARSYSLIPRARGAT